MNEAFAVSQQDYANLGRLMVTVGAIGLVPLLALPLLWRHEQARPIAGNLAPAPPSAAS